jgi:hypothetical protein
MTSETGTLVFRAMIAWWLVPLTFIADVMKEAVKAEKDAHKNNPQETEN